MTQTSQTFVPRKKFPLVPGTKRPAVPWRTFDGDVPTEPYGLPTGAANGVWVLDLDCKNGASGLAAIVAHAAGREIPDTRVIRTPSGGFHMYWAWSSGVRNRQAILPGVDVRGEGGYVCAGGDYSSVSDAPPAEAPEWLLDLVRSKEEIPEPEPVEAMAEDDPRFPDRVVQAKAFLKDAEICVDGQGGQARLWATCLRMSRTYELPPEVSLELMADWNSRCQGPWPESDILRTLRRAATEGHGPTGTFSLDAFQNVGNSKKVPTGKYSFDLAREIHGGDASKAVPYSQRQATMVMCGEGAAPAWAGVWRYDEFRHQIRAHGPPLKLDAETTGLSASDIGSVRMWYACLGAKVTADQVREAVEVSAKAASFHPVRDYLDALPETSREDADRYFSDVAARLFGGTEEESRHIRRLAVGAVRRIRRPGTKLDTMLVLAGPQGYNKSRMCAKIFSPFFREQMPDLAGKEASAALEGAWGVELAELASFSRASEQTKKDFLSRSEDQYRPVWERHVMTFPRQCVFIGTTNEEDFLDDATGDRRYDVCDVMQPIAIDAIDRDEFWSAANALEAAGEVHYRHGESSEAQKKFRSDDPWTDSIMKVLRKRGQLRPEDALSLGPAISLEKQDKAMLARARKILRRACGPSRCVRIDGETRRYFALPESVEQQNE